MRSARRWLRRGARVGTCVNPPASLDGLRSGTLRVRLRSCASRGPGGAAASRGPWASARSRDCLPNTRTPTILPGAARDLFAVPASCRWDLDITASHAGRGLHARPTKAMLTPVDDLSPEVTGVPNSAVADHRDTGHRTTSWPLLTHVRTVLAGRHRGRPAADLLTRVADRSTRFGCDA